MKIYKVTSSINPLGQCLQGCSLNKDAQISLSLNPFHQLLSLFPIKKYCPFLRVLSLECLEALNTSTGSRLN